MEIELKNRQELDQYLAKSIVEHGLRDILNKYNIPASEPVTMSIQRNDKIIASQEVPQKSTFQEMSQESGQGISNVPLTNIRDELIAFLNQMESDWGLFSNFLMEVEGEEYHDPHALSFDVGDVQISEIKAQFPSAKLNFRFYLKSPCGIFNCCAV